MDITELKRFFMLENYTMLFTKAITPKSCGGGEEFKLLALLGDRVLNLELFKILSIEGIKDSGTMTTRVNNYIHNEDILSKVGRILQIDKFMNPMDFKHKITKNEIKESIEALIGANFKAHGYGVHTEVIKKLYKIIQEIEKELQEHKQTQLFTENPKGRLLELFQKFGLPLPTFDTQRIGGTDNLPLFKCILIGKLFDKEIKIESDLSNNIKDVEKDAATKFLMKLDGKTDFREIIKPKEITLKTRSKSKDSLELKDIIFSIQGEDFTPEEIRVSSGTDETLYEWAKRKSIKRPFSMLVLLSNRLNSVEGSSWHASIPNSELILSKRKLDEDIFFEIGFAESKNKAKKAAARKFIKNSKLFEWLKTKYGDKLI